MKMPFDIQLRSWNRSSLVAITLIAMVCGCGQVPSYSNLTLSDFESLAADGPSETKTPNTKLHQPTKTPQANHGEAHAKFSAARQLEHSGEEEKAMKQYKRLTREYPAFAPSFHRLGVLHDRNEQSTDSAGYYETALKLDPENAELLCDYGYSRYLQGDWELAERTLRKAIEIDTSFDRAHNNLALVLASQGKDRQAIAAFQDAGFSLAESRKNLSHAQTASRMSERTTSSK